MATRVDAWLDLKQRADVVKARIDPFAFYTAEIGREGKRRGRNLVFPSPFREESEPSFTVYPDGRYVDYGESGKDRSGDCISFVQRQHGYGFRQAVEYLEQWVNSTDALPYSRPSTLPTHKHPDGPPPDHWQQTLRRIIYECQRTLRQPAGAAMLAWLHHQRRLTDETIDAAQLGYNPHWLDTGLVDDKGDRIRIGPGLLIPGFNDGSLYYVKVRPDRGHRKYLQVSGGHSAEALYNADQLRPDLPGGLVESELDAILMQQTAGDLATFCAVGGIGGRIPTRYQTTFAALPATFLIRDNDKPGADYAKANGAGLPDGHRVFAVPAGKDPTEYVADHAGNARTWLQTALNTDPDPIWSAVPNSWRAALSKCLPDAVTPLVERLTAAGHLIPNKHFNRQQALALGLTVATVDNGLAAGEGVIWERDHSFAPLSYLQENQGSSARKTMIGAWYRVFPLNEITTHLLRRAACRIWESCNPTGPGQPLGLAQPGFFEVLGYTPAEAPALADELNANLADVYHRQGHVERQQEQRAKDSYERLKQALRELHSTPLPENWSYKNAAEYRAALARGLKEAHPQQDWTVQRWAEALGVSERSVAAILTRAGIASTPQFIEKVVTSAQAAEEFGYAQRAYPRRITAQCAGKPLVNKPYHPALIDQLNLDGYQVIAQYQTVNKQTLVTEGKPEAVPRQRNTRKPAITASDSAINKPLCTRHPGYRGPGYDPAYSHWWLEQACGLKLSYQLQADGRLIARTTGEIISEHPDDRLLVDLLRNKPVVPPVEDELLCWLIDQGAILVSITPTPETAGDSVIETSAHATDDAGEGSTAPA